MYYYTIYKITLNHYTRCNNTNNATQANQHNCVLYTNNTPTPTSTPGIGALNNTDGLTTKPVDGSLYEWTSLQRHTAIAR